MSNLPPALPHAFYGLVTFKGNPAPVGSVIEGRGEGVRTGVPGNPIITTEAGKYGGMGGFDPKLVIQGTVAEGTPIRFYVNDVQAQCAMPGATWQQAWPFMAGGITRLDLRVPESSWLSRAVEWLRLIWRKLIGK